MGCCKCEEYEWRDPQAVVWRNPADGNGYCVFHAPADRKYVEFGVQALCSEYEFTHKINAKISNPDADRICFSGTIFPFEVGFAGIEFKKAAYFEECTFEKAAYFQESKFHDLYSFWKAKFYESAHFGKATFFREPREVESFYRCVFNGTAYFDEVTFEARVSFRAAEFIKRGYFRNVHFCNIADLTEIYAGPSTIIIGQISAKCLGNIHISSREVESFSFFDVSWPQEYAPIGSKYAINLEELYRALKHKAVEEHDQYQVSRWHYREKLMALKRGGNGIFEAVMLWLYWATSGFGERAVRAGVMLAVLIALSFAANSITEPWVWSELPGSAAAQYTMATIPFAKDIPGDGWVKVGRGLWQLLIAIQFTLFALAVRNRFRR